jgi:hypothetical protein
MGEGVNEICDAHRVVNPQISASFTKLSDYKQKNRDAQNGK